VRDERCDARHRSHAGDAAIRGLLCVLGVLCHARRRSLLLGVGGGLTLVRHPLLEASRPLGRATSPLAQTLDLPALREEQQREHRDAEHPGDRHQRADLGEGMGQRKGEGCRDHRVRTCEGERLSAVS
jgi:hypothetical protein